jgi:uncharacterized protein YkwD
MSRQFSGSVALGRAWLLPMALILALATGCRSDLVLDLDNAGSAGASGAAYGYLSEIRSGSRLPALAPDPKLERAALRQAEYMASSGRMEHDTGWRRDFAARMEREGVAAPAAENLAHGRMETGKVFEMWMASSGHRRNMLDPRFSHYGLAYASAPDGRRYWALVLGK